MFTATVVKCNDKYHEGYAKVTKYIIKFIIYNINNIKYIIQTFIFIKIETVYHFLVPKPNGNFYN